jgi:hypothetical protein
VSTPIFIKAIKPAAGRASTKKPANKPAANAAKDAPVDDRFSGLLAMLKDHKPGSNFGPETVKPESHVTFKAGSFVGAGKVRSAGKHGVTVEDSEARRHSVHWHEVTGHTDESAVGGDDEE